MPLTPKLGILAIQYLNVVAPVHINPEQCHLHRCSIIHATGRSKKPETQIRTHKWRQRRERIKAVRRALVSMMVLSRKWYSFELCFEGRRRDLNPAFSQVRHCLHFLGSIGRG